MNESVGLVVGSLCVSMVVPSKGPVVGSPRMHLEKYAHRGPLDALGTVVFTSYNNRRQHSLELVNRQILDSSGFSVGVNAAGTNIVLA